MDKVRILIVDDHALMRDGIRALLSPHENIHIVGEASDGKDAIEKAQELAPDVILMDIAMPGTGGLEAIRRIRKKKLTAKILVLSQYDNKKYALSAIRAGADGYVPKRALASELVLAIFVLNKDGNFFHPAVMTPLIRDYMQRSEAELHDTA